MPDPKIDVAELPDVLPGHWETAEGHEKAREYATMIRADLCMGGRTDLDLANAVFMAGRHDLDLIHYQTAAKERMRWLSVQLALKATALEQSQREVQVAWESFQREAKYRVLSEDRAEASEALVARLRGALEPFAKHADETERAYTKPLFDGVSVPYVSLRECRAARQALQGE
jgi:hypothetical protein